MEEEERQAFIERLRQNAVFAALSELDAELLLDAGTVTRLAPAEVLFSAGAPCSGLYLLLEGTLEVLEGEVVLARVPAGHVVGEMAFVRSGTRGRTVRAMGEATTWMLSVRGFELLVEQGDPIAAAVLDGISRDICRRFRASVRAAANEVARLAATEEGRSVLEDMA